MVRYVRFYTRWHRRENDQFSTLRCTKTGSTQPKLSAACFVVQSCLADADFVVFSNYCLIGTRQSGICFFLAISTRTRSAEPNMERGSARVRVCQKQEGKSMTRSGICISKCEAALVSVNRGILFIKTNEETM